MKNLIIFTSLFVSFIVNAQIKDSVKIKKAEMLKELSDKSCSCIDSINVSGKDHKEISLEIKKCISDKVGAYQLFDKLLAVQNSDSKNEEKKTINIEFNSNEDSKEYKSYYYDIERYLNENCSSLRSKAAVHEKLNRKSISDNPKALQWYSKGISEKEEHNDCKKALEYFQRAVKEDSDFPFAWDNIGYCNRVLGNYDEAIKAYKKSISIDPMGKMPLQNLAVAYIYKKEYYKAIESYENLKKIDPLNPEADYGIGNIYLTAIGDSEKALNYLCKAYNRYIEMNSPYRTDAEKLIGIAYQDMKKNGKEAKFHEILKNNKITTEQ